MSETIEPTPEEQLPQPLQDSLEMLDAEIVRIIGGLGQSDEDDFKIAMSLNGIGDIISSIILWISDLEDIHDGKDNVFKSSEEVEAIFNQIRLYIEQTRKNQQAMAALKAVLIRLENKLRSPRSYITFD